MSNRTILTALGTLLALTLAGGRVGAAPQAATVERGAACSDCHDVQAKTIEKNPHFLARKSGTTNDAVCESCHGDGARHVEAGGDKALIASGRGVTGAQACLSCHVESKAHSSYRNGMHAPSESVSCATCHSIHTPEPKAGHLLAKAPDALCASCHPAQKATSRDKPFGHRPGRVSCISCHDPHGRPGKKGLQLTRAGELPCLSCHSEKRGPFVFEHVTGVTGDCMSCHETHGSSNPKQLTRSRVDHLCLECHTSTSGLLGSQPPSSHDTFSPRFRSCTTCHVAVHGSNRSPKLLK